MRVGFIGLGTMGGPAARNIMRRRFPLVVHDIRAEAAQHLIEAGAEWGATPADVLARVDAVVTMVFGPKEVEQVARGEHALFSGPCEGKLWIDLTNSPHFSPGSRPASRPGVRSARSGPKSVSGNTVEVRDDAGGRLGATRRAAPSGRQSASSRLPDAPHRAARLSCSVGLMAPRRP